MSRMLTGAVVGAAIAALHCSTGTAAHAAAPVRSRRRAEVGQPPYGSDDESAGTHPNLDITSRSCPRGPGRMRRTPRRPASARTRCASSSSCTSWLATTGGRASAADAAEAVGPPGRSTSLGLPIAPTLGGGGGGLGGAWSATSLAGGGGGDPEERQGSATAGGSPAVGGAPARRHPSRDDVHPSPSGSAVHRRALPRPTSGPARHHHWCTSTRRRAGRRLGRPGPCVRRPWTPAPAGRDVRPAPAGVRGVLARRGPPRRRPLVLRRPGAQGRRPATVVDALYRESLTVLGLRREPGRLAADASAVRVEERLGGDLALDPLAEDLDRRPRCPARRARAGDRRRRSTCSTL